MSNSSDFVHLLSRDYRPAGVAQIKVSDKFSIDKRKVNFEDDVDVTNEKKTDVKHSRLVHDLTPEEEPSYRPAKSKEEQDEEASRLVLQLVSKTPEYSRHLQQEEASAIVSDTELKTYIKVPKRAKDKSEFSSSFHKVALGDWESKIEWDGYKEPKEDEKKDDTVKTESPNSAEALLQKRRNPFLDNMDFDNLISWTGEKEDVEAKAKAMPLILELGVAGQSIARHVLPSHRPTPCIKSLEYQTRIQVNWTGEIKSTAELSKGTLRADKEQKERFIAQRQEKRRQMAKDKTNRVTDAMGTLNVLAGGRGRTITSSLMGPGGTERTGRPSRRIDNASHDTEYVEQLDMVTNHSLFRDLSKVSLRQFHRPRLPWAIVRTSLLWQFGIRQTSGTAKGGSGAGESHSSTYQAMVMGTHAGAVSKAKMRSEADLTPTEGNLVLLEYCEERPPIQMTKGMASKIVTYYRGDKSRCPVSAGGGDRPTRKRRGGSEPDSTKIDLIQAVGKSEKPHRLKGPNDAMSSTITDWVGKPPQKNRGEDKKSEQSSINVLPEGVTEILHPKVHGPFIGEIEEGQQVTGLVSNLYVAPIFQHESEHTDFLMILGRNSGASTNGRLETLSVILRELPSSIYTVGQLEPRTRVWAPNTQGEKNFTNPLVSYLIAKVLTRTENREGHGLRLDEIQDRVLPNVGLANTALRQRLKHVAIYDKNTQIWTTKQIGYEDYPGVEALGKSISAEGVAAFEVSNAAVTRLKDLGIYQLFAGAHACSSVGVAMVYLAGQVNAVRESVRKVKGVLKAVPNLKGTLREYYEEAIAYLEALSKALRRRHEVAKFIYEELQLAPWHLSGEFYDVHKKGEGTGMMKLTGLGDPSGVGEGFSFLREVDAKPSKSVATGQINQKDKITGTEDDLRKLTMKQMANILRSYGMAQKDIDTLKRWDRVHVIRDLSTKAASDGIGDGLERFARGEKMKLSDQKQMYRDRIQVIWKRQIASLSDSGDRAIAGDAGGASADADDVAAKGADKKKDDTADDDSDLDDEDDFAAEMEEEMMDRADATKIVAAQGGDEGRMRARMMEDEDLTDAKNLVNLKKEKAEARAAREGLTMNKDVPSTAPPGFKRKVVRRRITKTHPDGRVVTTFKFIVHAEEVGKIMARLQHEKKEKKDIADRPEYPPDEKQIGHAMFEDEDDFEFSTKGRGSAKGRRRRGRAATTARGVKMKTQFGKLRTSTAKGMKKRRRDEDDIELYNAQARRKGTSNRKERGSIRDRRPHVIFANRLEAIRSMIESRPQSGPFHRAVDPRAWPKYYEVISDPIHLSAIRDKIKNYEYRTTEGFLKDFQLMRANAIKFNGAGTAIAEEGVQIFDIVKTRIEESRGELADLEEAVQEQLSTKPKKKKTKTKVKAMSPAEAAMAAASGDTWADIDFDNLSDDSD
mmetsp:Transcript_17160/g.41757  ORF Transcript_17160/g.41757 Transcript_17160/m.41757 type:complete len:1420 (+) Transcript_17160:199-4458(+)